MKFAHLIGLLLFAVPRAPAQSLPDLGDVSQATLSSQQERRIGNEIMREIRADKDYLEDAELTDYLNNLGYRLVSSSEATRQDFEFFAIQDNSVNAFALPGGYIGVHTGLILAAQSESELAAVLAHEIAHVTQKHLARMLVGQKQSQLVSIAALAIAILAARSNSQVSQAALATGQALSIQSQLDFTREHEHEADRIGLQILEASRLDPRAMPAFLERLQKANRLYESSAPAYLRTHPLTFERIADVQNRTQNLPYRQVADSNDFQLLHAKLRANQGAANEAVTHFESALGERKYGSEAAHRYGLVTALMRAKNFARAENELSLLRKNSPPNAMIETLAGQLKLAMGDNAAALDHYRAALRAHPRHRALIYDYAVALLQYRQGSAAIRLVNEQLQNFPNDHRLYALQARCYAALGKRLQQHQAQAESYVRQGNIPAAIEQLQIALKSGDGDFYQLSTAEARLRELRRIDADNRKP